MPGGRNMIRPGGNIAERTSCWPWWAKGYRRGEYNQPLVYLLQALLFGRALIDLIFHRGRPPWMLSFGSVRFNVFSGTCPTTSMTAEEKATTPSTPVGTFNPTFTFNSSSFSQPGSTPSTPRKALKPVLKPVGVFSVSKATAISFAPASLPLPSYERHAVYYNEDDGNVVLQVYFVYLLNSVFTQPTQGRVYALQSPPVNL